MIPRLNLSNVSIYIVESFLKYHSFQETEASCKTSCQTNRSDKLILNFFGVEYREVLVLSTQEKASE